jgi:hypothetical protein
VAAVDALTAAAIARFRALSAIQPLATVADDGRTAGFGEFATCFSQPARAQVATPAAMNKKAQRITEDEVRVRLETTGAREARRTDAKDGADTYFLGPE